ncbi:MAG: HAD-IC family P-type ATPase [Clostridia bacterium]|nr:HAD-IC family P-type ATPase [Clostridia bacterium]
MALKGFRSNKLKDGDERSGQLSGGDPASTNESEKKERLIEEGIIKQEKKKKIRPASDMSRAKRYEVDHNHGLNDEQIEERVSSGYINVSSTQKGRSYLGIVVGNLFTFFNVLVFIVAGALIWAGAKFTQLLFLGIILANVAIGIIQEIRSKRTIEKLSLITAPTAVTIRNGVRTPVPVDELVIDDVISLETGNQICSDCILMVGECEVNESVITGESVPVIKKAGDMLYSGSYVSSGTCYARVEKVGADNYIEKLASNAKRYKKPKSELRNSIMFIIKIVTVFIIPISILMIFGALGRSENGIEIEDIQRTINSVSGAIIGMIPAGMFLLTSMALAISVIRLAKKNALVQDLYCIEMLARVDVLCLDKTGTLTDGTMRVNKLIQLTEVQEYSITDIVGSLLAATGDNNQTAIALSNAYGIANKFRPSAILPFSSQRKLSAVTFEDVGTFVLGAPEFVIRERNPAFEALVNENAADGFRMVVIGHSDKPIGEQIPTDLKPLYLIAIEDHIREDAIDTIAWFKQNDVAIKIISGDNPITVAEVAKRVGVPDADKFISLDGLSSQEVVEAANQYTVFGRVTPEQKCLLIRAQKAKGHTVAMMGDGVNDILAMREADCSVAIASGSEAARNVSHLVLLDSNFSSMPSVVGEGRRVVNNITKSASLFLMKTFMSIVLSLIFLLMGEDYPLHTNHLLILEILIIGVPSFVLALQSNKQRIQGNFLSNVVSRAIPGGFALVLNIMAVYVFKEFLLTGYGPDAITAEFAISMMVIALSWTGFMILLKICEPFNAFRIFLLIIVFVLMLIAMAFMDESIGIVKLELANPIHLASLLFIVVEVLVAYFTVSMVMKLLTVLKVMTD